MPQSQFRCIVAAVLTLCSLIGPVSPGTAQTGGPPQSPAKPAREWLFDRTVTVSPRAAPVPALKYRLFPHSFDRKDGNAVPIYLRLTKSRSDEWLRQLREKPAEWNKLALDKLPLDEVHKFLATWGYNLKQIELAARRKTADWSYTMDTGDIIGLLLPDVQEMRLIGNVVILKARAEIAENKFADALHTLETAFSLSQQVGEPPILICALVGGAVARETSDALLSLMERPEAPNLYWALTAMPRPLIDIRNGLDFEERVVYFEFPELADLDRPRSPEQWDALLTQVRSRLYSDRFTNLAETPRWERPAEKPKLEPAADSPHLPEAKKYLAQTVGLAPAQIDAMPPAQVLLLYLANQYREISDNQYKGSFLPYSQGRAMLELADKRLMKSLPKTDGKRLAKLLLPNIGKAELGQLLLERKLAALRVIEALRLHAAAHDGQLPDKLRDVSIVPVPDDPGTGKPFEYHKDGDTATLISRIPDEPQAVTGLRYRITMRK